MTKNKVGIAVFSVIVCFCLIAGSQVSPVLSVDPPSWAMKIVDDLTISGLTKDGERQEIRYLGKGGWDGVEEVWSFAVWRVFKNGEGSGWTKDLQAHLELAKIEDGVYRLEIYHSWRTLEVDMPYSFTVEKESDYLLVLEISTDT